MIDEAESLAKQLRDRPTTPAPAENTRRALDVRNPIATLLADRMSTVRSAARFVFRDHPEIARESGSAYRRRRRAAARRASANAATNGKPQETTATTATTTTTTTTVS